MEAAQTAIFRLVEERYPPNDALHGTPHEMLRRVLEIELPDGKSTWEQTDYGHPGRFNDWEPRRIDTRLQPKTARLKAAAQALGELTADR